MGESTKAVSTLCVIVGVIATVAAWFVEKPDAITWSFRLGSPMLALAAGGLLFKLHTRRDIAPDYLRELSGNYFFRDGLGFICGVSAVDGCASIDVYFQNQQSEGCIARIGLRPLKGINLRGTAAEIIRVEFDCPPGAFGVARLAVPIVKPLQGKVLTFHVGASVTFPAGKGNRLRFHDGLFVRTNDNLENPLHAALTIMALIGGSVFISRPAEVTLQMPESVSDTMPLRVRPEVKLFWKLGDPPLAPS